MYRYEKHDTNKKIYNFVGNKAAMLLSKMLYFPFHQYVAMGSHHRKLIFDNSTSGSCSSYCNPNETHSRVCPISCIYSCFPTCEIPFPSEILPPLPSILTTSVPPHYNKPTVSVFTIILVSFVAISFFILTCYVVYRFNNPRISQSLQQEEERNDDQGNEVDHPIWYIRTVGLEPSVIRSITICKYRKGERLIEGTVCSVCLNEFEEDETLRILPKCNHAFHMPCIDTWLTSHTNCPICRAGIITMPEPASLSSHQNSEETRLAISENTTHDIGELGDRSENSKEYLAKGDRGMLSETYASLESLSKASMARASSSNSSTEHWGAQNSGDISTEIHELKNNFHSNESSAGNESLYLERGMQKTATSCAAEILP